MTSRISSSIAALGMVAAPAVMKFAARPTSELSTRDASRDAGRGRADADAETDPSQQRCGVERWSIKVGDDGEARDVDLHQAHETTIDALRGLPRTEDSDTDVRILPTEESVFVVRNVKLAQYKREADSDYHLVLRDAHGNTMIAEIPEPGCLSQQSPWRSQVRAVRAAFDDQHEASGRMKSASDVVSLVGVAFFDVLHGQAGVAPNGIELHPVLEICFGRDCRLDLAPRAP